MVMPRRACCSVSRSDGATLRPDLVVRVAAHQASINGSIGAIMKSECKDTRRPLRTSEPARTIWSARSWPRPSFA